MSKYMNGRPAGMSDEEDDNDDFEYFSFNSAKEDGAPSTEINSKNNSEEEIVIHDVNESSERKFECSIINACESGLYEMLEEYCSNMKDINGFLYTGWTPLLHAASFAQLESIKILLKNGADPNQNKEGFTPVMALCYSKNKGNTSEPLECLKLLISAQADINIIDKHRETALMYACKMQSVEFVTFLLEHIKDINDVDSDNKTALHYAAAANRPDIVKVLLEHNANASIYDKYNLRPKHIAKIKEFTEVVDLLEVEEEEEVYICLENPDKKQLWEDLFPHLYPRKEGVSEYVEEIMKATCLKTYIPLFTGMHFKTFLQLTEDDIVRLGIDITVHRDQFLENLEKFHNKKWNVRSLGILKKSDPYTIYNGLISLMNIKIQIDLITASFQYVKNNLIEAANKNVHLFPMQKLEYKEELRITRKTLKILKDEVVNIKKIIQKIDEESGITLPGSYIGPKKKNYHSPYWNMRIIKTITLSITLVVGLHLYKIRYI